MLIGKRHSETACLRFFERRKFVLSSIGILSGTLWNNSKDGGVVAAEFADSNFLFSPYVVNLFICLCSGIMLMLYSSLRCFLKRIYFVLSSHALDSKYLINLECLIVIQISEIRTTIVYLTK